MVVALDHDVAFAARDDGSGWSISLARRGWGMGSITAIVALVAAFIFFPVTNILTSALRDNDGNRIIGAYLSSSPDDYGHFLIRYY